VREKVYHTFISFARDVITMQPLDVQRVRKNISFNVTQSIFFS